MFDNIRADVVRILHRSRDISVIDVLRILWVNFGLQALVVYRFGRWLGRLRKYSLGWLIAALLYPVYWILSVCVRMAYGINLAQSADIAPGFYINHFGGIEVRNCCIGSHCNIQQQVKLGSVETTNKGLVIGERVYIGAHAQIYTNVKIGDGATIGAGAVITQDIPSQCLVVGNPSRISQWDYDNGNLL
jgi:serine O-acetyltransferase